MNTLFKKIYLLAGVIMAANMFVVNEVEASADDSSIKINQQNQPGQSPTENTAKIEENKENDDNNIIEKSNKKQSSLDKLLSWENYFNFFGTLALSSANSYFKWWDYNAGSYCKLRIGCLGWRTKKFFDTVQLDFNLNLGRGAIWLIPHIINLIMIKTKAKKENTEENNEKIEGEENISGSNASPWVSFLIKGILQGFISIPLTIHIYNFSISISLDSMLWEFVIDKKFFKNKQVETVVKPPVIQNYKEPSQIYDFSTTTKI